MWFVHLVKKTELRTHLGNGNNVQDYRRVGSIDETMLVGI